LTVRAQDTQQSGVELHILFTSDLHSHLLPQRVSGEGDPDVPIGGYARIAGLIRDIRDQQAPDTTLVVDAGDFSMGTVFHTLFSTESLELRLMGDMGYDVTTLGNHDFDFHPDGLARALMVAAASKDRLPRIVAANVVFSPSDPRDRSLQEAFAKYPVPPFIVLQKAGFRIGIFGILGKDAQIDAPFARPVTFSDPVIAARGIVQQLKAQEHADVIVCLSHSGISADPSHSEDERLAREVPDIDILISGHTHSVLPEPIRIGQTILGAAGSYGQYLGTMTVSLAPRQRPRLVRYALLSVNGQAGDGDPLIVSKIRSFEDRVDREFLSKYGLHFGQILAESPADFPSLASTYDHPGETGLGDLIADAFRYAVHRAEGTDAPFVHIAIEPLGNIRASLLRGSVRVEDVFQVLSLGIGPDGMPGYPLITVYLNGTEIKKLLEVETTVSALKRDAHLQVSGVRFQYNPHRLPFDRVTQIAIEEPGGTWAAPVADRLYRIALNSYTAQMVGYVSHVSHGLLSMTPKHADGSLMQDWKEGIVWDRSGGSPCEIKEWLAMARYLEDFPDLDGDGVADIPARYLQPEGRIGVVPSWNPWRLVLPAGSVTIGVIGMVVASIGVAVFLYGFFRRRAWRRHPTIVRRKSQEANPR
jgi:2',3'-cyclic-nucleotide 2'-phosphodiesterase (5'-nucleotidase family)